MTQATIIYALQNGKTVSIEEVPSGKACNCSCPACGEKLIARKGAKNAHSFAHESGSTCAHALESSLHIGAKRIIEQEKMIFLPAVRTILRNRGDYKNVREAGLYDIEKVELEVREENIVPDIVVTINGLRIFIEILVTHAVDDRKMEKLRAHGVPTLEIDLGDYLGMNEFLDEEALRKIVVFGDGEYKKWIFDPYKEKIEENYLRYCRYKVFDRHYTSKGGVFCTSCSVRESRSIDGWVYGEIGYATYEDCCNCKYKVSDGNREFYDCYCGSELNISRIEDLLEEKGTEIDNSHPESQTLIEILQENEKCVVFVQNVLTKAFFKIGNNDSYKRFPKQVEGYYGRSMRSFSDKRIKIKFSMEKQWILTKTLPFRS